ncbi:MAG: 6,7-dimethyl-8-ribityllumazine synthase [Acidobacteria bacterium]|nr:MAG: 6,7-dimethyl-8-ribityllumazine synthase [Acidobacteriota bacterium]
MKETIGKLNSSGLRIGVVVSRFNSSVTERLLEGVVDILKRTGATESDLEVVRVPGSFEIPLAAKLLAEKGTFDAIVCLSAIIKGQTDHYTFLSSAVTNALASLSIEQGIPVGYGIVTADTVEQALDRAGLKHGNKGVDAALAAIEMANLRRELKNG